MATRRWASYDDEMRSRELNVMPTFSPAALAWRDASVQMRVQPSAAHADRQLDRSSHIPQHTLAIHPTTKQPVEASWQLPLTPSIIANRHAGTHAHHVTYLRRARVASTWLGPMPYLVRKYSSASWPEASSCGLRRKGFHVTASYGHANGSESGWL